MKSGWIAGMLLLSAWTPAAAEIYKCTSAGGEVQYSDKPCAGQATIIKPAAAPDVDMHVTERRQRTEKLLHAIEEERAEGQRKEAKAEAEQLQRRKKCARARNRLTQLNASGRLFRFTEDGNREYFSESERVAILEKAQVDVAHWCD